MMGLRAPPSDAQAARAKKLRERATVIAAKGRYNKQGAIPAAILGMLYDFVEECDLERARDVGLFPRTALPRKDLETPRLNHKDVRSLGTGLPPASSFPLAGASLLNIDFSLVPGVDIKCGHCGGRAVRVTGNTARVKDRLGAIVLHRPMQPPIFACSAIQTCDDCKKTTRHDDPAVLAKLGPCDDMLLPCEHEQCVGTRQHRATREFVDLVSSATGLSDAGWETVSREHSEALAVRRSRNHLSFASCLADYTATLEAYVGDDVELDDDERDARSAARAALDGVQWSVAQGRSWVAAYDDSSTAAGGDLSADSIRDMWLKGAKSLKTFRIREQQDVKLGKDDVLSYDGCPRLGKAFQGPCGSQAQVATFTGGYHQIVSPILVRDGTYAAIQPAVRAAVAEGTIKSRLLSARATPAAIFTATPRPQKYRETDGGPLKDAPPLDEMLGWNIETEVRAGRLHCPCARMPNGKRHRQHPRADCLHGIALKAQQNGPRGVVGKRQRRKGGK